jgi:hypothetical protein
MDAVKAEPKAAPEGYKDTAAFLTEMRERFEEGVDNDRDNREAAYDDLKFIAGEQWDETVKAERVRKGRPCLTINTLPQYIGQVIGDIRTNRPSIKVRPAEDGDKDVAEVRQGLIRFIENQSNAMMAYAMAGEDQVSCGIGHFRASLVYSEDDSFDQDIRISHIPDPFSVVWDPQSVEPTGADARFCFVVDEVDRKAFEAAYPEAITSELTVPLETQGWISRDSVRITEYWLMKEVKRRVALVLQPPNTQPQILDVTDNEQAAMPFIVADASGNPRIRDVTRKVACMYLTTGQEVLEGPFEYPIKRVPVFRVSGREVRIGPRRYRYGLVRFAKDSARMKNLMRSAAMEWVAMAPKAQWLLHASDAEEANRYRNAGKSGDTVLTYSGQIQPQRIDPPSSPAALLQEAQFNDQDIKDVTGLHDASLGMRSNETSGKAILARERQGDVATYMYHDNLNAAIRECGRVVNDLIPVVYDTARTIVVLGEDGATTAKPINDPNNPEAVDLKIGKYDIVVETGPSYSTKRQEAAESMMAFVQAVPAAGQVAADLIAKAQDWPMADEIGDRLTKMLPPNITAKDPKDMTPEEQQQAQAAQAQAQQAQAMQQQAQGMAMQKAQLDLAEQEAKVKQAIANARKAEAEADQAEAEARMMPLTELDRAAALMGRMTPEQPQMEPMPGF